MFARRTNPNLPVPTKEYSALVTAVRIRSLRLQFDFSQQRIADILGITDRTLCEYESGRRPVPVMYLFTIAGLFGVTIDYLAGLSDEAKPTMSAELVKAQEDLMLERKISAVIEGWSPTV